MNFFFLTHKTGNLLHVTRKQEFRPHYVYCLNKNNLIIIKPIITL